MIRLEGKAALVFLVLLILGLGFSAVSVSLAGTWDWPMFHHDPEHTGVTPEQVTPPLALLWSYTTGGWVFSSPAVCGGVVYVGSYDGRVYALNASTGAQLWNYTTGGWVDSSPAVCGGVVYVGSNDNRTYALNATTGAHMWNYTTGGLVDSSPAVSSGVVYVGSYDGHVYALNASTGAQLWNYTTIWPVDSSPAVSGGGVYIGSLGGQVYALNASTGAYMWSYTIGVPVMSSPAVCGDVVYVGSVWTDNRVYALNALTGAYKWSHTIGGSVMSSPAVCGSFVYVGSVWPDNRVYALNALTGAHMWNYTTGGLVDSSPAVSSGVVYVGSWDNCVYALNGTTGAHMWNYTTGGPVGSSPAVSSGVVFVGSADGSVYAFAEAREVSFSASGLSGDCSGTVLTVDGAGYGYGDLPRAFAWAIGSQHTFEWASNVPAGSGKRYVWTGTAGLSTARSSIITVPDGNSTIEASYKPQFYLTVYSPYGTPTGEGWYDDGSTVSSSVSSPVSPETGTMHICTGWTGTGSAPAPGAATTVTFPINTPSTVRWSWKTQHKLTMQVSPSGAGSTTPDAGEYWYDMGETVQISASPTEDYVFGNWTGSGSGSYTGLDSAATVVMNAPVTETAYFYVEVAVTFSASGLTSQASGTVLMVDGFNYCLSDLPKTYIWTSGSQHVFEWALTAPAGSGVRFVWNLTSGLSTARSGSVTAPTEDGTIEASYKTEYHLTTASAYGSAEPATGWFESGATATASVTSPILGETGTRYVCTGWTGTGSAPISGTGTTVAFTVNSPTNVTWNWKTQYYLTVNSPYGSPTGEGWYDDGSAVSSSVSSPVSPETGTMHVCTGWTGTGSAPISGTGTTVAFTVNSPTNVTWNWKTQYHLSVESSYDTPTGEGWYDDGSEAAVSVEPAVPMEGVLGTLGARWVFSQWTGDVTSTSPAETVVMDQPKQVTAAWTEDYTALGAIAAVLIAASAAALILKKKQQQGTA